MWVNQSFIYPIFSFVDKHEQKLKADVHHPHIPNTFMVS